MSFASYSIHVPRAQVHPSLVSLRRLPDMSPRDHHTLSRPNALDQLTIHHRSLCRFERLLLATTHLISGSQLRARCFQRPHNQCRVNRNTHLGHFARPELRRAPVQMLLPAIPPNVRDVGMHQIVYSSLFGCSGCAAIFVKLCIQSRLKVSERLKREAVAVR